jgi:predicted aspartyl protease
MGLSENGGDEVSEKNEGAAEYAIKQVGDRYYPVIIDREAGGHYEIRNSLTGGILSYNNPEAAESYIKRAQQREE